MTKLEPTRTSSDLTATERLRTLLDERGVEWDYGITGATTTRFDVNGVDLTFTPMRDGLVCSTILTPEQAIAATLGTGTCLPHFWTHDRALHIEATRMPTRIVVCEGGTCEFVPKRELDASEAENAKLRELAGRMLGSIRRFEVCSDSYRVSSVYEQWMCELGVEVDE